MTNVKIQMSNECQMTNDESTILFVISHLDFVIHSTFNIFTACST